MPDYEVAVVTEALLRIAATAASVALGVVVVTAICAALALAQAAFGNREDSR